MLLHLLGDDEATTHSLKCVLPRKWLARPAAALLEPFVKSLAKKHVSASVADFQLADAQGASW